MKTKPLLFSATVVSSLLAASLSAQINSNGTGGGVYNQGTTWDGGTAPVGSNSWNILSGDAVTTTGSVSINNGAAATVSGSLTLGATDVIVVGGSTNGNLLVNGGAIIGTTGNTNRIFGGRSSLTITSGSISGLERLSLTNTDKAVTDISSFTMSGGSISDLGLNGLTLFGADDDDSAQFTIIGNAGTLNIGATSFNLFNSTAGYEDSAADINFIFGTAAGAGALTVAESRNLKLGGNAFILDFTNIDRSTITGSGSFTTTLFDYDNSLVNSFGDLTSLGLGAGESASLFLDTDNKLIGVNYTLVAVPEPSTYAFICAFSVFSIATCRRRVSK